MEILINALIRATGWSIIHSLWQGAILYTLLLLLFLINPKLSSKMRHNLSFMTLASIFLWFAQTFYSEFVKWLATGQSIEIFSFSGISVNYKGNIAEIPSSILFDKAEQSIPLIVFIYSLGLVFQIIFLLLGYYRVWQIRTKGLTDLSEKLNKRFSDLSLKTGIKRTVRFAWSSIVSVPLVIGYFKPIVLLPLSVLTQFNPQQLEAIIIHELSHIRRNDYLLNILKITIETILFFNPFVWLSGKLMDTERENACDDLVLKITGSPLSYARTLLELEKLKQNKEIFIMAITGKKYYLLNRIKRITNMKTSNLNLKIQLLAILIAVTGILSMAWIPATKDSIKEKRVVKSQPVKSDREFIKNKKPLVTHAYLEETNFENKTDTLKKKIKIIIEDEKGNKKEYSSLAELPDDIRAEFLKQNRKGIYTPLTFNRDTTIFKKMKLNGKLLDTSYLKDMKDLNGKIALSFFSEMNLLKKISEFDSTGIMNGSVINKLRINGKDIWMDTHKMTSDQIEKLKNQKKSIEDINKQLNTPWSKQQLEDIRRKVEELQKLLQSPEFKKQFHGYMPQQLQKINDRLNISGITKVAESTFNEANKEALTKELQTTATELQYLEKRLEAAQKNYYH